MIKNKNFLSIDKCYLFGSASLKLSSLLYSSVITIFFIEHSISYTQIGVIWSILLASQMICDYPTGGLADEIGRLKVFMIGMVISGISNIVYLIGYNYIWILYIGALLAGLGEAQISGTLLPWLITEYKKNNNYEKKYILKLISKNQIVTSSIGIALGMFIYFIKLEANIVLMISAIINIIGGVLVFGLWVDNKSQFSYTYMSLHKKTVETFIKEKKLWIYTILLTCGYINFSIYQFIWQPKISLFSGDKGVLTFVNSMALLIVIMVSNLVKKIKINRKSTVVTLFTFLSLIILVYGNSLILILAAILFYRAGKAYKLPIINAYIHEYIPDDIRSSTTSLVSTISSLLLIMFQPLIGAALDKSDNFIILSIIIANFIVETFCLVTVTTNYSKESVIN